jgi:hypothetical protein
VAMRNRLTLFMAITAIQGVPAHKIMLNVELFPLSHRPSVRVSQQLLHHG